LKTPRRARLRAEPLAGERRRRERAVKDGEKKSMKIRIIGGPGSGKSTLARKLSRTYGIPSHDLDELQWDAAAESYGKKRDAAERDALLRGILEQDEWIIEGVYYAWCAQSFADADRIFLLNVPRGVCRRRIIRRFIRRKLGAEKGKKETLGDLRALLRWSDKYRRENMIEIRKTLAPYADKLVEISAPADVGQE
jgi:adenylate kinase family enzyme